MTRFNQITLAVWIGALMMTAFAFGMMAEGQQKYIQGATEAAECIEAGGSWYTINSAPIRCLYND